MIVCNSLIIYNRYTLGSLALILYRWRLRSVALRILLSLLPIPSGLKLRSDSPVVDLGAACWNSIYVLRVADGPSTQRVLGMLPSTGLGL